MNAAAQQQRPAQAGPAGMAGLIRPEQVARLPQLDAQKKQQYHTLVAKLWEIINSTPNNDPKHQEAQGRLLAASQQLMHGVKQYRAVQAQARAQAQAHAQARAHATGQMQHNPAQGQQPNGVVTQAQGAGLSFDQLNVEVQQLVNEQHFFFPPAIVEGTQGANEWLKEAKARYGQALQRTQMAKNKKLEIQRAFQQREVQGNPLTPQERSVYHTRVTQCNKAIEEGQAFMKKFKEQQALFQRQQSQQRFTSQNVAAVPVTKEIAAEPSATPTAPTAQANTQGAPSAHSITSAVNAARTLAAQQPGSPAHPQSAVPASATTNAQMQLNSAQSPAHTQPMGDQSRPSSAHPNQAGTQTQSLQAAGSAPHAHPLSAVNGIKAQGPTITKNLQVAETKPVQMPPSRPTLNGGAGVGLPGQVAQPALTQLPGFVLESSEDGRVLSKKKLNEIVREVCGPGTEDQLSADAEEIFLQVADDFVDNLVQASCRLARLRGSNSLDPKDIMVVLEQQYNIRIPGYSTDELRTARKGAPAAGWAQKMSAVQAAKLTGGASSSQALGSVGLHARDNNS